MYHRWRHGQVPAALLRGLGTITFIRHNPSSHVSSVFLAPQWSLSFNKNCRDFIRKSRACKTALERVKLSGWVSRQPGLSKSSLAPHVSQYNNWFFDSSLHFLFPPPLARYTDDIRRLAQGALFVMMASRNMFRRISQKVIGKSKHEVRAQAMPEKKRKEKKKKGGGGDET